MAPRGVGFAFPDVREAHPGEKAAHHATFGDKPAPARRLRDRWRIGRPILVDGLDGPLHRVYGPLANTTYVVGGGVLNRGAWTDAASIGWALEYLAREAAERRTAKRAVPFHAELRGFRAHDAYARIFMRGRPEGAAERLATARREPAERS